MNFRPSEIVAALVGAGLERAVGGERASSSPPRRPTGPSLGERGVEMIFDDGQGHHRPHRRRPRRRDRRGRRSGGARRRRHPEQASTTRRSTSSRITGPSRRHPCLSRTPRPGSRLRDAPLVGRADGRGPAPHRGRGRAHPRPRLRPLRLVAYTDASVRGGAEQTLGTLLAALDPAVEVTVLGVDREVAAWVAERRPGARIEVVPEARNKADVGAVLAHLRAIRRLRPDVLHVNDFTPWRGQYAQLAGLLTPGVRVVVWEHSTTPSSSRCQRGSSGPCRGGGRPPGLRAVAGRRGRALARSPAGVVALDPQRDPTRAPAGDLGSSRGVRDRHRRPPLGREGLRRPAPGRRPGARRAGGPGGSGAGGGRPSGPGRGARDCRSRAPDGLGRGQPRVPRGLRRLRAPVLHRGVPPHDARGHVGRRRGRRGRTSAASASRSSTTRRVCSSAPATWTGWPWPSSAWSTTRPCGAASRTAGRAMVQERFTAPTMARRFEELYLEVLSR